MSLLENPFAILGASPRDRRETLFEFADSMSLLLGKDTEKALTALLQPVQRLRAELAWFPNTEKAVTDTVLAQTGEGNHPSALPGKVPEGLGCPLAKANAIAALFFQPPALYDAASKDPPPLSHKNRLVKLFTVFPRSKTDPPAPPDTVLRCEPTAALLAALNRVLNKITPEETLFAVNEDRKRGGWDPVSDQTVFASILSEQLQRICSLAAGCIRDAKTDADAAALAAAFADCPETDGHDTLAIAIVDEYLLRIRDAMEKAKAAVLQDDPHAKEDLGAGYVRRFEAWRSLVHPVLKLDVQIQHLSRQLASNVRECILKSFLNAPKTLFQADEHLYTQKGVHVFKITYQNVTKEMVEKASENVRRLTALFPEDDPITDNLILTMDSFQLEYDNVKNRAENTLRRAVWKQDKEYREHPPQTFFGMRFTEVKAED